MIEKTRKIIDKMLYFMLLGIFMACFVLSTILFEIHFKITEEKYIGILNEYENKKK